MDKTISTADRFASALEEHAPRFGIRLDSVVIARLKGYYELVTAWNARLHLVAPCPPEEFATRHVLESLLASQHLTEGSLVTDIGSGAGLPIIPCLVVRTGVRASLIESSQKKAVFLREALRLVGAHDRAEVKAVRFEDTPPPVTDFVTCRALDRFTEMLPKMVEWSKHAGTLLFFGGESLGEQLERLALGCRAVRVPESERRYLFIVRRVGEGEGENRL